MANFKFPDFEYLALLETFDPRVFVAKDKKEQEVCCFILSLALIYNDFKDLSWALYHIDKGGPDNPKIPSSYNGQYGGMKVHLEKLYYSLLNELFKTIEKKCNILSHQLFTKVYKQLPKRAKNCWDLLVNISLERDSENSQLKIFFKKVRNKITYHSDIEEIFSGYKEHFMSNKKDMKEFRERAYLSRGDNLSSTRFYFADAAVGGYLTLRMGSEREIFLKQIVEIAKSVNNSLFHIVEKFIMVRGGSFRKV